ncbi:putative Ig domain-containing protein [Leptospira meyeri]|uniref:Putative Ig domain-containing protein n=1 Tax=Leptospira meyeri TaxID=29508 RepID=A0A4R8MLD7_LEPME|nr:LamG-like jellyroll fold domain-containing protein [Leptospira meyeri]EKJ87149.1 Ig domain protein [Leptospira meyeri serovar Hardjo str. Went 5]TDY68003.1 putative Ig domain-containing protein [Leptospira meyeri]
MKSRICCDNHALGEIYKLIFVLFFFSFSAFDCNPSDLSNAGDVYSREFKETQILACILKGKDCIPCTGTTSLSYPQNTYLLGQNFPVFIKTNLCSQIISCKVSPALPTGLTIQNETCEISGSPTTISSYTDYLVTATTSNGETSTTLRIGVEMGSLVHLKFTNGSFENSGIQPLTLTAGSSLTFTTGYEGDPNGAIHFNTTDISSQIGGDSMLPSVISPRTICIWLKPDALLGTGVQELIFSYGTLFNNACGFGLQNTAGVTGLLFYSAKQTFAPPAGIWTHICISFDGTNSSYYTNGSFLGSQTNVSPASTILQRITFGSWGGGYYYHGGIDGFRVFGSALSATAVSQVYQGLPVLGP